MVKALFVFTLIAVFKPEPAYAPPIGAAQRHAAMQTAAPWARRYRIPLRLASEIIASADRARVPRGMAFRLIKAESAFDSLAVSVTGALGLTQVLPSTGRYHCPGNDLLKVRSNLDCGLTYLKRMHRRYGDWWVATFAYNMGPAVADTSKTMMDLKYSQMIAGTN